MTPKTKRSAPPPSPESEARRLKSLAESKLQSSDFKSALKYARRARRLAPDLHGVSLLVTALKILRCSPSDHYKILRLDPFSPPSLVRSQYKTLALSLHPDKSRSPLPGLDEAFKRVANSFRFLSDRSNKKRFDDELRVRIVGERSAEAAEDRQVATFWTACDTCRILHEFDRRYVGHRLVCPSCRKSFLAVEVKEEVEEEEEDVKDNIRVTGARSRMRSRPGIPIGWVAGVKRLKIGDCGSSESKKPKVRKEKTLAEIQLEIAKAKTRKKAGKKEVNEKATASVENEDLSLMAVEDSDFYDFDKDRTEKSFVKGQIWAVYDDDDGMPRHYGLIEDILSLNPFRVKMCWLDVQNNGDEALVLWEKSGYHISCGRFKVGRKVNIDSVNFFSHLVECERAAKELYRIYPKKGSIWALYGERATEGEEGRCYNIVVFLTSYSEMYGLSMAYLEKVEGYKTIFKRQKIGAPAVTWLEKEDVRLFSHQIPARKLSTEDDENLPRECWELDPASLPSQLLRTDRRRKRRT